MITTPNYGEYSNEDWYDKMRMTPREKYIHEVKELMTHAQSCGVSYYEFMHEHGMKYILSEMTNDELPWFGFCIDTISDTGELSYYGAPVSEGHVLMDVYDEALECVKRAIEYLRKQNRIPLTITIGGWEFNRIKNDYEFEKAIRDGVFDELAQKAIEEYEQGQTFDFDLIE